MRERERETAYINSFKRMKGDECVYIKGGKGWNVSERERVCVCVYVQVITAPHTHTTHTVHTGSQMEQKHTDHMPHASPKATYQY